MDIGSGFPSAGELALTAARRAGADKDRVVVLGQQLLQAFDAMPAFELDTEIEDVIGFLVDHRIRQPEFRNLRAHHSAAFRIGTELRAVIAEGCEIAPHLERSRTTADDGNPLAV